MDIHHLKNAVYSKWLRKKHNLTNGFFIYPVNSIMGGKYIHIGPKTNFGKGTIVTAWDEYEGVRFHPSLEIGADCNFGDYNHITCINKIKIGNNLLTGRWVTISDNDHGSSNYEILSLPPVKRPLVSKGPVVIEDNVWIGDKATILAGVTIGKGAIIAANAVVTQDVPPFYIAAGVSAKIIKTCE